MIIETVKVTPNIPIPIIGKTIPVPALGTTAPVPVLGKTNAIFDTGTTQIVGDPAGIQKFFARLEQYGAKSDPQYGDGIYTSTWARSAADRMPHDA